MANSIQIKNTPRLIVIIPEELAGSVDLARRVYSLAHAGGYGVAYLALLQNPQGLLSLERSLSGLRALTAVDGLPVTSRAAPSGDWEKSLREIFRPGDALVCLAGQRLASGLLSARPAREILEKSFKAAVMELGGIYHPAGYRARRLLLTVMFWAGAAAILAGFTLLEIHLDSGVHGAARVLLLLLLAGIEISALYVWNNTSQP